MALSSQQIKDMQSWYGAKADGIWGSKSTTAADGRTANTAYNLYNAQKNNYRSYTDYISKKPSGGTQSSGTGSSSGINANTIREMQKWYGTDVDGIWGKNSTAAAGGRNVNDAYTYWKSNSRYGSYSDYQNSGSQNGSSGSGYTPGGSGYYNSGLSDSQIKEMQSYYGTNADGKWGQDSTAAAGGLSAADAWNAYQESMNAQTPSYDYGYDSSYDYSGPMSYSDYLQRVGGDDYQAAVQKAIEAQVQAATDQYNSQIESAGKDYEENARRAYINKMMSQRNMDQELAANGVYGGMADSQRIDSETGYENDLTDLTNQYQSTISDLQQAITSAKLAGDAQAAEAMANYLSQVQAQYASYLQNERSIQAEIDMFNRQLAAQQAQEARAAAYSGSSGSSGSSSGGSGYNAETAEMQKKLNAMGANLAVDGVWGSQTQAAYDRYMGGNDTSGYTLTNRNGNGWIALDGGGRFSYNELQKMLDSGQVREVVNDRNRTVSYVRVR